MPTSSTHECLGPAGENAVPRPCRCPKTEDHDSADCMYCRAAARIKACMEADE
jgi:hypothetical protein